MNIYNAMNCDHLAMHICLSKKITGACKHEDKKWTVSNFRKIHLFEGKEEKNKLIFLCTLKKLVDDFAFFHWRLHEKSLKSWINMMYVNAFSSIHVKHLINNNRHR